MYAGMHAHVIRATTSDLDDKMDYWSEGAVGLLPHYMGGRDWVITLMHPNHPADTGPAPGHGRDSKRGLDVDLGSGMRVLTGEHETGEDGILRADVAQVGPIRVMTASTASAVVGGAPEHGAMIEDESRTWALWVDPQGRPASMWLRREESGAVVAPGIGFDDDRLFTVEETSTPYPESYDTDTADPSKRVEDDALRASAAAYHDAVASLNVVTRAPLSTTIGHLIRSGYLRPANPRGKFFVRWADGRLTVDSVPVPDKPGQWDVMAYQPPSHLHLDDDAKREIVHAVACTVRSLTGLPVDDAVLA